MALVVRRLRAPGGERDELIARVEEGHPVADPPPQLELEQPPVERECVVEVAHLERHVVDADEPRHHATWPRSRSIIGLFPRRVDRHSSPIMVLGGDPGAS